MITAALLLAQFSCPTRADIETAAWQRFREAPAATAIVATPRGTALLELLAKEDNSTWTLVLISPDGCAWPVAIGEGWQPVPWQEPGNPA